MGLNPFTDRAASAGKQDRTAEHDRLIREIIAETTMTEDELQDFCKQGLADFKVPKHIRFVSEFPMTVTGKLQKFRMRKMAIEQPALPRHEFGEWETHNGPTA